MGMLGVRMRMKGKRRRDIGIVCRVEGRARGGKVVRLVVLVKEVGRRLVLLVRLGELCAARDKRQRATSSCRPAPPPTLTNVLLCLLGMRLLLLYMLILDWLGVTLGHLL